MNVDYLCPFYRVQIIVGVPGFEPGVARTQNENVSRYTTLRCETTISYPRFLSRAYRVN